MKEKPQFKRDRHYSRREIHEIVGGGSTQLFLPWKDGKVLCGCFTVRDGPDVPEVILVSEGRDIYGATLIFCEQKHSVPVFVVEGGVRTYRGEFHVRDWTEDENEIARQRQRSGRTNIKRVVYLDRED